MGAWRRLAWSAAAAVLGAGLIGVGAAPAAHAASRVKAVSTTFQTPAFPGDFPDPVVIVADGRYWAYSTGSGGRNLQVISSTDMRNWSAPADPLPALPPWASAGLTWAPGVMQFGSLFVMYYTVHDPALGRQCISVATSVDPAGPFVDSSAGPLVCQIRNGGSIDPNPYYDAATRTTYLIWKSDDNAIGRPTHIWGQALTPGGLTLAGAGPTLLLTQNAAWQSPVVEGPTVVRNGSTYYLFYGGNRWDSSRSGIGYATSRSVLGSYANQSRWGPWLASRGNAVGPQGPWVFTDAGGVTRMAFAAWRGAVGYQNGGVRAMWIGALGFSRYGTPTLT